MQNQDPFLTTAEFASLTGISTASVSRWLRQGKLEGVKRAGKWMIGRDQVHADIVRRHAGMSPIAEAASGNRKIRRSEDRPSYTVDDFSAMTYLTPFGVRKWLKNGRLKGWKDQDDRWQVDAASIHLADVKRLLR